VISVPSNTALCDRPKDDLDLNTVVILDAEATLRGMDELIYQEIVEVASGKQTRAEILGHREFAIHGINPTV
jgi:altronate dehydratase large subunit